MVQSARGHVDGNMVIMSTGPSGYKLTCLHCKEKFEFRHGEELVNYVYLPDFTITAKCPNCANVWMPEDEPDEDTLYITTLKYEYVSQDGSTILEKERTLPMVGNSVQDICIQICQRAGATHKISSLKVVKATFDEYTAVKLEAMKRIAEMAGTLFEHLFGDPNVQHGEEDDNS